jgi:hypothetical protein
MAQLHSMQMPQMSGWDTLMRSRISVIKMCLFYAVPLSIVPPAMIYYAGIMYGGDLLPSLTTLQLVTIGGIFFAVELAMTFLMAYIIQQLGSVIDIKPRYEDAYKLAVVVPTPLWLAPLFLFIPSFVVNITAGSAALMLAGILIFYSVPSIFKIEEEGHAILLAGSILAAGMVAWVTMMLLTLVTWSFISSSLLLMI